MVHMQWHGSEPQKTSTEQKLRININGVKIPAKKHVKLLGVEIDNRLKFDRHIEAHVKKSTERPALLQD